MMDFLHAIQPWYWLILGFLLLGLEALGAGGFLLGSAAATLLTALLLWLSPDVSWAVQLVVFASSSLILTIVYWKAFRKVNERSDYPELNQRAAQLVGREITLMESLAEGQGKIQVGDTLWKVETTAEIEEGTKVVIKSYRGMVLLIKPK